MRTATPSTYILLKVLLKYLHQATTASSGFNSKVTTELKCQTQGFSQKFLWGINNYDNAENISLFNGKILAFFISIAKQIVSWHYIGPFGQSKSLLTINWIKA